MTLWRPKKKKLNFDDEKKVEKKVEDKNKNKENDFSLNLEISAIDKSMGFNDLSMSVIKHLQGINLNKKQVEKINSIIEEVEEDEWVEVKNNKKKDGKDEQQFTGIVGLNESRQYIEVDKNKETYKVKNKKNRKKNNKKNNSKCINFNNKFASLKVNHDSDDEEEDEK